MLGSFFAKILTKYFIYDSSSGLFDWSSTGALFFYNKLEIRNFLGFCSLWSYNSVIEKISYWEFITELSIDSPLYC